jgi:hypothetical protein
MAEPVTIGGQTFVKTAEGWIDKKTKTQAPEGLFKLLNTLSAESTGDYKRLRVRVDRSKPPITIANDEYIFDLNQGKWLNKKTKDPVNDSLQKIINGVLAQVEAEKGAMASSIADSMGISGQAARSNVRSTGTLPAPNIKINSPIVSMIETLATIDGYLKQRLSNQKKIASQTLAMTRENAIEASNIDASPVQEVKKEDATKSNAGNIAAALLIGGLIASQFEPVQEAFKTMIDGVKGVFNFVNDVAKSIADGLDFFTGASSSASSDTTPTPTSTPNTSSVNTATPSTPNVVEASTLATPSESNKAEETTLATAAPQTRTPAQSTQRNEPSKVRSTSVGTTASPVASTSSSSAQPSTSSKPAQSNTRMATPSPIIPDAKPAPSTTQSASPNFDTTKKDSTSTASGDAAKVSTVKNVVPVNHPETGEGYGIAGANDQSGRPIAFSREGAEAFSRMMADSGGAVKPSDVASSKRSPQKNSAVGGATNSPHLRGVAMDIHGTSGEWIRQNGHKYGWKPHDYSGTHGGHFVFGGAGMDPSGSDSMLAAAGQAVYDLGAGALKAIGNIIGAGLGPQTKRSVTESLSQYAPNTAGEIAMASVKRSGDLVEAKTLPVDTSVSIKDPMNLNKNKPTDVVQNVPTSADFASVDFYLTRMGFPKIIYTQTARGATLR